MPLRPSPLAFLEEPLLLLEGHELLEVGILLGAVHLRVELEEAVIAEEDLVVWLDLFVALLLPLGLVDWAERRRRVVSGGSAAQDL